MMGALFNECSKLSYLPDISKWNLKNVLTIQSMFNSCNSLIELPDISKWNIRNNEDLSFLFLHCTSLKNLPDISKWNTYKVKTITAIFNYLKLNILIVSFIYITIFYLAKFVERFNNKF